MREATGNALLVMMVTSIITIIMIFFVGSISYSKAYKIKNYIINQIEEHESLNSSLIGEIDTYLKDVGYNVRRSTSKCPNVTTNVNSCGSNIYTGSYEVCIYECGGVNTYYKVITYMKFDFPVIGNTLKFQVKGETRSFNDFN